MLTKPDIEKYFIAEKQESLLFLIIGIASVLLPLIFYFIYKNNFIKGFCIPFIIIGIIQIVVGYTVYARSDNDRTTHVYNYDLNPVAFKTKELPRMQKVNNSFTIYKYIELALLVVAIALLLFNQSQFLKIQNSTVLGISIALAIQSFTMLIADLVAQQRAILYTQQIQEFINNM